MINYIIYDEDPRGIWDDEVIEEGNALSVEGAVELFRRYLKGIPGTVRRTNISDNHPLKEGRWITVIGDMWNPAQNKKYRRSAMQFKMIYWEEG